MCNKNKKNIAFSVGIDLQLSPDQTALDLDSINVQTVGVFPSSLDVQLHGASGTFVVMDTLTVLMAAMKPSARVRIFY